MMTLQNSLIYIHKSFLSLFIFRIRDFLWKLVFRVGSLPFLSFFLPPFLIKFNRGLIAFTIASYQFLLTHPPNQLPLEKIRNFYPFYTMGISNIQAPVPLLRGWKKALESALMQIAWNLLRSSKNGNLINWIPTRRAFCNPSREIELLDWAISEPTKNFPGFLNFRNESNFLLVT